MLKIAPVKLSDYSLFQKNSWELKVKHLQHLKHFIKHFHCAMQMLRTPNLAGTFRGSIWTKAHSKFWRKGSVGISRDCPNYLRKG